MLQTDAELQMQVPVVVVVVVVFLWFHTIRCYKNENENLFSCFCQPQPVIKMAVSGANLHNVFMLLTLEPHLARNPYLVLHVRRNHLVSDTLRELTMYSDVDLKKPLKVRATLSDVTVVL